LVCYIANIDIWDEKFNFQFNELGSESQRLLLLGEVEVFGHFIEEGVGSKTVEVEDGEGIDPVFDGRGEEDSFVCDVLLDLVEIVF
jgi:hypothetical protein